MMKYYSLRDKKKKPQIGKLYRLIVDGDEAIPIVINNITESEYTRPTVMVVEYSQLNSPDYSETDTMEIFCEWYGEW